MKRLVTFLIIFAINCIGNIIKANGFQILYNGTAIDSIAIQANPEIEYTFTVTKPDVSWDTIYWTVAGGIEIVSQDENQVVIRSRNGETYESKYSKYAAGSLTIHAKKIDIEDDCECAQNYCNPNFNSTIYIFKIFDLSGNAIAGQKCVVAGDTVTYSVAPWVTQMVSESLVFDYYYWTIPEELKASDLYYSTDQSSVTFVVSENIEGQVIKVQMGMFNIIEDANEQEPLTFTLGRDIDTPQIEGMIDDLYYCLPFETDTFTLTINNASDEAIYEWDLRTWELIEQNNNGSEVTIVATPNSQTIFLTVTSSCSVNKYYYDINRSLDESYEILNTSESLTCLNEGDLLTFYIPNVTEGTELTWEVVGEGWNISASESVKTRPTITIGSGTGIITVFGTDCQSPAIIDTFFVAPKTLSSITGETCITQGLADTLVYSVDAIANIDYYEWSYPENWTVIGDTIENSITLISDGETIDTIKVRGIGCSETEWVTLNLHRIYNAPEGITIDDGCIDVGSTSTVYLSVIPDGTADDETTYKWTIPTTLRSGSLSRTTSDYSTVKFTCRGNEGSYIVKVSANNSCSTATYTDTITLSIDEYIFESISYGDSSNNYDPLLRLLTVLGGENDIVKYTWVLDGEEVQSNATYYYAIPYLIEKEINDLYFQGEIDVIIEYSNGCTSTITYSWDYTEDSVETTKSISLNQENSQSLATAIEEDKTKTITGDISIYPNPTNGILTVELSDEYIGGHIIIFTTSGTTLDLITATSNKETFNITNYPAGIYILYIIKGSNAISYKISKQ